MPGKTPVIPTGFGTLKLLRSFYGNSNPKADFIAGVQSNEVTTSAKEKQMSVSSEPKMEVKDQSKIEDEKQKLVSPPHSEKVLTPGLDKIENGNKDDNLLGNIKTEPGEKESSSDGSKDLSDIAKLNTIEEQCENHVIAATSKVESKAAEIVMNHVKFRTQDQFLKSTNYAPKPTETNWDKLISPASTEADEIIFFPLESAAAGIGPCPDLKEARFFELSARQKAKEGKQAISESKLVVTEARLGEFEAKLRARQARIDERHATLCRRRAIIKRAEDRLQDLESRLVSMEEELTGREQVMRSRERKVKQDEIQIQIQEANLKRRQEKMKEQIKEMERRNKIMAEKEAMSSIMNDIMTKKENQPTDKRKENPSYSHTTSPVETKKIAPQKDVSEYFEAIRRKEHNMKTPRPNSAYITSALSTEKDQQQQVFFRPNHRRSNSYEADAILREGQTKIDYNMNSLHKTKRVMGLWL